MMNGPFSILLAAKDALVLSALFYLPGLAWAWLLPSRTRAERCGIALAIGLPLILIPAILLAEFARLSMPLVWSWAGVVLLSGLVIGRTRGLGDGWQGFLGILFGLFLLFALPQRGEWIAGGWDPGVNMNQGLLVARTGHVAQPPEPIRAAALRDVPGAFAQQSGRFTEVFPGLPADPETGALQPYFYRATPTLIALCDLAAGRSAALRVNQLAGGFAIALFVALLATTAIPRLALLFGTLALACQPIVLAHTANPASEMMELTLVCAVGLLLPHKTRGGSWALALALFLGALNRSSFLFQQSFLLLILGAWDASDADRRGVTRRHAAIAASLLLALAWYAWIAPASLVKIFHLRPLLWQLALGSIGAVLTLDALLLLSRRALPPWTRALALFTPLALLVREFTLSAPWAEFLRNAPAWFSYASPAVASLGLLGLLWRFRKTPLAPWLLWLCTALLAVLLHRHAAELYPWATKRWLAWSPPLLATGIALLLAATATASRPVRAAALLLVAVALGFTIPLACAAWRNTEYNGATRMLDTLNTSLSHDDLIVSDHFLWGTPLALAYGHAVLNAEQVLAGKGDADAAASLLAHTGRRIILVNSTSDGLNRWPASFQRAQPLGTPIELETRTLIQHRSHRGYEMRDVRYTLQRFLWIPAP